MPALIQASSTCTWNIRDINEVEVKVEVKIEVKIKVKIKVKVKIKIEAARGICANCEQIIIHLYYNKTYSCQSANKKITSHGKHGPFDVSTF